MRNQQHEVEDLPDAIVDHQLRAIAYEAVLSVTSRVVPGSLADFLR